MDLFSIGANAPPQPQWRSRLAAMGPPDLDAGPQPQNAIGAEALAPIVMQHLVRPVADAFGYFGRTLRGEEPLYDPRTGHPSDEAYGAAGTLAGLGMTGGIGAPVRTAAGEVALGAGPIRAYHGSPHDFERFDLSKIGTGEGAQAYGHGLYFAENEGVARSYRDALSAQQIPYDSPERLALDVLQARGGDRSAAIAGLRETAARRAADGKTHPTMVQKFADAANALEAGVKPPGRMYEVGIHADPQRFLDWDRPLAQQPPSVRDALKDAWMAHPVDHAHQTGEQIYRMNTPGFVSSGPYREPNAAAASQALREAGIPGIQYLDQGSRGAGAGSLNRVVFDDKLVEILRKYGLLGPVAGGAAASALPGQSTPEQ